VGSDQPVDEPGSHKLVHLARDSGRCSPRIDEDEVNDPSCCMAHLFGGQDRTIDNGGSGHAQEPGKWRKQSQSKSLPSGTAQENVTGEY